MNGILKIACAILLADAVKFILKVLGGLVLEMEEQRDAESIKDSCVIIDMEDKRTEK